MFGIRDTNVKRLEKASTIIQVWLWPSAEVNQSLILPRFNGAVR